MRPFLKISFEHIAFCLGVIFILAGCGHRKAAREPAPSVRTFPMPADVPALIVSQDEKIEWMAGHYWDRFLDTTGVWVCDTAYVNGVLKDDVEEQFGIWVSMIENLLPLPKAIRASSHLFDSVQAFDAARPETNVFNEICSLSRKYFYDPNSPARNEDIYLPFVEKAAVSPSVPDSLKPSLKWEAHFCSLNRTGTVAADFSFREKNGRTRTLHGTKADRTLLIFSNPGCPECARMIEGLSSPVLNSLIKGGKLAVVDIYIDEDVDFWREHASEYPSSWIVGYDPEGIIRKDLIYGVRALPSLYLLDRDKRIVLKDSPVEKVLSVLETTDNQ